MSMPAGKRVGPPSLPSVTIGNLRLEAIHWGKDRGFGQNGGWIAAFDVANGQELWTLKIYDVKYHPQLEEDVQDVFIKSMTTTDAEGELAIIDENDRRFIVDIGARSVRAL